MVKRKINPIFFVGGWLTATLSLVAWWLVYGLRQLETLARLENRLPAKLIAQQRMLHWEGLTLFLLLFVGGGALFYYALRENRPNRQVAEFFGTLTHEFKTPLASLRLQAESLQEDVHENSRSSKLVERLVRDTVRLELQLENALFLASIRGQETLHLEEIGLQDFLKRLKNQWPELEIKIEDGLKVRADSRALEGIFKNIFLNARVHGKAPRVLVTAENSRSGNDAFCVRIADNGLGYSGDIRKLGSLFSRPTAQSGSGVGLYLSKSLARRMNGRLEFAKSLGPGFTVDLWLEKARGTS